MTVLVACLGDDPVSWSVVFKLASLPDWSQVVFVGSSFAKSQLQLKDKMSFVVVSGLKDLDVVRSFLDGRIFGDTAVSLFSGSGELHMVVLSAVLKAGGGVRLVHYTSDLIEV